MGVIGAVGAAEKRATGIRAASSSSSSAASSSAASAHERLPSRMPRMMGSVSLKGDENRLPKPVSLLKPPMPLEPSPKLSDGANAKEVMDESKQILDVLMLVGNLSLAPLPFQFLFKIDIFYEHKGPPPLPPTHPPERVKERRGVPLLSQVRQILFEIDTPAPTTAKYPHHQGASYAPSMRGRGQPRGVQICQIQKKIERGRGLMEYRRKIRVVPDKYPSNPSIHVFHD